MSYRNNRIFIILLLISCLTCSKSPSQFTSFSEAIAWYESQSLLEMKPDSTAIYCAKYHPGDRVLIIYFQSKKNKGYIYGGVSPGLWKKFTNAASKGKFYQRWIKGRYQFNLEKIS